MPAAAPRPIVDKMHSELVKVIRAPESIERLAAVGAIPIANTPEQFADYLRQDVAKWAKVVKDHGMGQLIVRTHNPADDDSPRRSAVPIVSTCIADARSGRLPSICRPAANPSAVTRPTPTRPVPSHPIVPTLKWGSSTFFAVSVHVHRP